MHWPYFNFSLSLNQNPYLLYNLNPVFSIAKSPFLKLVQQRAHKMESATLNSTKSALLQSTECNNVCQGIKYTKYLDRLPCLSFGQFWDGIFSIRQKFLKNCPEFGFVPISWEYLAKTFFHQVLQYFCLLYKVEGSSVSNHGFSTNDMIPRGLRGEGGHNLLKIYSSILIL